MLKPLCRQDIAFPTVQANCRFCDPPSAKQMELMATDQITLFESNYKDFQLIESFTKGHISNCPTISFDVRFSLEYESGISYRCRSQAWIIFAKRMAYTVGLSGSDENIGEIQSDIKLIVSSILVGQSG